MGMGEPFLNYDNVLAAVRSLNDPAGFGLGARQIAISTAGWVPGIERLAGEPLQVKLALSLHAPNDALRGELMPVTQRFPIARLMAACRDYRAAHPPPHLRRVPDAGRGQRQQRAGRRAGRAARPRRLPRQPDRLQPDRRPGSRPRPGAGRGVRPRLRARGVSASYRRSHGQDIDAACGQLAVKGVRELRRARRAPVLTAVSSRRYDTPLDSLAGTTMARVGDPA